MRFGFIALLALALATSALAEDISIRGKVQGYSDEPIFNIKVSVYDDERLVTYGFTSEEGTYLISLPATDKLVSVLFDTSPSLNNSRDWHPSVVSNIGLEKAMLLDRRLMRVGTGQTNAAALDALHGYQFAAMWLNPDTNTLAEQYAEDAGARIGMLKIANQTLTEMQQVLRNYFNNYEP